MKTNEPTPITTATPVEELLAAGKALGQPIKPGTGFAPHILRPKDYVLEPLTPAPLRPLPDHIRQNVTLQDEESFIDYVKAFRTSTTRIFASAPDLAQVSPTNAGGAALTALLDYHEGSSEQKPGRVAHIVTYPIPLSLEFATWLGKNGVAQRQLDFINFIERNAQDVTSPDSATLMELVLNFEAKSTVNFQSKVDRVTGGRNLTFQESIEAGGQAQVGQMKVPELLTLDLPIFEGGRKYAVAARLEYRPSEGKLTIAYHLQRPHQVFRQAWEQLRQEVSEALECGILTGAAELHPGWDEPK